MSASDVRHLAQSCVVAIVGSSDPLRVATFMRCHATFEGDIGCWLDVAGKDIAEKKYGTRDQAEVQSKLVLNVLVAGDLLFFVRLGVESAEKQMGEVRLAADVGETHDSQELDGYEHTRVSIA